MKDLIVIGAGPAGLAAAIYGKRAGLDLVVIEKLSPGGQVMNTSEVENYPGFVDPVPGWELVSSMENQARRLEAEIISGEIVKIEKNEGEKCFDLFLNDGQNHKALSVIIAAGASYKKLDVPGEDKFIGRGVSYCATCDGPFFKDKVTALIGGGNTALEEADFLTKFAKKVYLIHRRDQFRGVKLLQKRVLSNNKIEPVYETVVTSINGEENVRSISIKNVKSGDEKSLDVDGVFIFVGIMSNTGFLPREILNEKGEVNVDMQMRSSIEGLFAAGDLRKDSRRQIVMAASDGATAALSAYEYVTDISL